MKPNFITGEIPIVIIIHMFHRCWFARSSFFTAENSMFDLITTLNWYPCFRFYTEKNNNKTSLVHEVPYVFLVKTIKKPSCFARHRYRRPSINATWSRFDSLGSARRPLFSLAASAQLVLSQTWMTGLNGGGSTKISELFMENGMENGLKLRVFDGKQEI